MTVTSGRHANESQLLASLPICARSCGKVSGFKYAIARLYQIYGDLLMDAHHTIPLSVLDLAVVGNGATTAAALADTTMLAQRAEALGYTRFWVAEHHNMPSIASTTPPVLIAHLAAMTSTIHVGSGGVMLPNNRQNHRYSRISSRCAHDNDCSSSILG